MKKRVFVSGIILCLIAFTINLAIPSPIIKNLDKIQIYAVSVINSKYEDVDITDVHMPKTVLEEINEK